MTSSSSFSPKKKTTSVKINKSQTHTKNRQTIIPTFEAWILRLKLFSPTSLENFVDKICMDIRDKSNPRNESEYIRIMQSHLMLEVWSQVRIWVTQQIQCKKFITNATLSNSKFEKHLKNKNGIRLKFVTHDKRLQIPPKSHLILILRRVLNSNQRNIYGHNSSCADLLPMLDENSIQPLNSDSIPQHLIVKIGSVSSVDHRTKNKKMKKRYMPNMHANGIEFNVSLNNCHHQLLNEMCNDSNFDLTVIPIKNLVSFERDFNSISNIAQMRLGAYVMGKQHLIQHKIGEVENLWKYLSSSQIQECNQNSPQKRNENPWHQTVEQKNNRNKNQKLMFSQNSQKYKYYSQMLNHSQLNSLKESLIKPLCLIHGPPGSGKTNFTLIPILNCAYHALKQKYLHLTREKLASAANVEKIRLYQPRIGVFAGSNQAVDEIIINILKFDNNVITDPQSWQLKLPIKRMGNESNMNPAIIQSSLLNINIKIRSYLSLKWNLESSSKEMYNKKNRNNALSKIKSELKKAKKKLFLLKKELGKYKHRWRFVLTDDKLWTQTMLPLIQRHHQLLIDIQCMEIVDRYRFCNQGQRELLPILMNDCEIIFSTANFVGKCDISSIPSMSRFEFAIFDECCQMRETETLISLQYCNRAILIGDPLQLQATILYHGKYRSLLLNSLFVRVEKYIQPLMLNIQYRMHPQISLFPCKQFYNNQLKNGRNVELYQECKPFYKELHFQPYLFYDIIGFGNAEEVYMNSFINWYEIYFIETLLFGFLSNDTYASSINDIGIITPYLYHKQMLEQQLSRNTTLNAILHRFRINIECDTVDHFQGSERDIIIFSCVRSNYANNIGFLSIVSRLNVAITRAKYALWIIGDAKCLQSDPTWKALIDNVKERNLFMVQNNKNCGSQHITLQQMQLQQAEKYDPKDSNLNVNAVEFVPS